MAAKVLMVQGTSSSVGKSLLTAALCRIFSRQGLRVAPFKAQNMSNNAAVCADGAEIGRAQAMQAAAAGIQPSADMNPVLLKPEANARSQVIVLGKPWRTLQAGSYYRRKEELWPTVTAALDRLRSAHDLVIIEGAGSPVELNLRRFDIVNMAIARHARAPVVLVGDIDRGGIFAQLLGTLWLLEPEERALVRGLVVNKFRGDPALFADGVQMLQARAEVPVLGVVPYLPGLAIPEEDAVALSEGVRGQGSGVSQGAAKFIDIAVIRLPHIANFDDFDALRDEPGVGLRYVQSPAALGMPHAIVLPGTKSTVADLAWLRIEGLAEVIRLQAAWGTAIVGICGGYQMLGRIIRDPSHVESRDDETKGLGLLPLETVFAEAKATSQIRARVLGGPGWLATAACQELEGYEIHMGQTIGGRAWLENGDNRTDGAASDDGRVWGCYLHGLFANSAFRRLWLASLSAPAKGIDHAQADDQTGEARLQVALDRLADVVETALDMRQLTAILEQSDPT
jgi:adenosylcobyric acid synthase